MHNRSLVSVVIPTYNRPQQTIAAIDSVLVQTHPNIEVIVVDDGSADGCREILERLTSETPTGCHRLLLISQPRQGPSVARNTGIARAHGEYIAFLDSDDLWHPEKLAWQLEAIERFNNSCAICVTDATVVDASGKEVSSFRRHRRNYRETIGIDRSATISLARSFCGFWMSSLLVRSDTIRQIGGFNPHISFAEDRDLHFRLSLVTSAVYVNKQLIRTDRTPSAPDSSCRPWDNPAMQFQHQQRMFESWLSLDTPLPPEVRSEVRRALGALYSQQANWHLENSRYSEARTAASMAVEYKATPGTFFKFALTRLAPALARNMVPRTRPIRSGGHAS